MDNAITVQESKVQGFADTCKALWLLGYSEMWALHHARVQSSDTHDDSQMELGMIRFQEFVRTYNSDVDGERW